MHPTKLVEKKAVLVQKSSIAKGSSNKLAETVGKKPEHVSMIEKLPINTKGSPYQILFDNLFIGFPLLTHLRERGCEYGEKNF